MEMLTDLQIDLALRLVVAGLFGAVVGLERELHGSVAGIRTHLLVALGSAVFTELSIFGFSGPLAVAAGDPSVAVDPTRIAAQIVSGIGFLGAGAILKQGVNISGLTTAASLWAVGAVGMAAGAGAWWIGLIASVIMLIALWPLNILARRLRRSDEIVIRLRSESLGGVGAATGLLATRPVELVGVEVGRARGSRTEFTLTVRVPNKGVRGDLLGALGALEGMELLGVNSSEEA
jgi:putative Mg2+ transporter-C (MgtC) family protein